MKVLKFGGTSVGSAQRMKEVAQLIINGERKIVVLSAMSGTTNSLVEISQKLFSDQNGEALALINTLEKKYENVVKELFNSEKTLNKGQELIKAYFEYLKSFTKDLFTIHEERAVLAQGELISTNLFQIYLEEIGVNSKLISALDFMRIDENEEPDLKYITENLNDIVDANKNIDLFVTQGFICRNAFGEIDNLKRGGSDYSASLIGAGILAEEIQIWTDIDGMHNNDPRIVDKTHPISELSFEEAAELAYFGAKILHPASVYPAQLKNIPVKLLNTMQPEAKGTLISKKSDGQGIKAIAAKDGIIAIKIKSARMLLAYGFLRSVFEVFERYKTPIDVITTSEVAVSVTIDNPKYLEQITKELSAFGNVDVDKDLSIICIVGNFIAEEKGGSVKIFESLNQVPIRMISYGGSKNNITLLVPTSYKNDALKALNSGVFGY